MKAMNRIGLLFIIISLLPFACREKSNEKDQGHDAIAPDEVEESANQALYNEVMKVHDDAMLKLNDIQRKRKSLKDLIASKPAPAKEKRKLIEERLARLDSAEEGMMRWMRKFNPLPDSTGEEKAREYLETEMENVKKVRENILQALKETEEN